MPTVPPVYRLELRSGGTVTFSTEDVNAFTLAEAERTLLMEIATAIKKYERAIASETPRDGRE